MKKALVVFCLFTTPVFAQQAAAPPPSPEEQQRIIDLMTGDMGIMHGQVARCVAQVEASNKRLSEMAAKCAKSPEPLKIPDIAKPAPKADGTKKE